MVSALLMKFVWYLLQLPKGNVGYVPDTVAVEPTFVAFLQHCQTYVHGLARCHSFKFL